MDVVYEALKKVPGISDTEAHEVANKINKSDSAATKVDLERMARMIIMWVVVIDLAIAGFIKYL